MLLKEKLTQLLNTNWSRFLDQNLLMKKTLEIVRDTEFSKTKQEDIPPAVTRISITKFETQYNLCCLRDNIEFEIWVEFTVPKNEGVCVGTLVYVLNMDNDLTLKESYGTQFY